MHPDNTFCLGIHMSNELEYLGVRSVGDRVEQSDRIAEENGSSTRNKSIGKLCRTIGKTNARHEILFS